MNLLNTYISKNYVRKLTNKNDKSAWIKMNKYIFTLALLQMVAQAQQQTPETVALLPGDDDIIPDEDNYEMDDDSLEDLLEDQYSRAKY